MKAKKWLIALFTAMLCVSMALTVACGGNKNGGKKWMTSDWTTVPNNTNPNLKYFGYFHTDGFASQGSYINEILPLENANVLMLGNSRGNADLAAKLAIAKENGYKATVSVSGMFNYGGTGTVNTGSVNENYQANFTEMKTAINEYIEDGTVLGFYIDEPAWNGIPQEAFRTVTKMFRDECPNTKVITTMTVYDIGVAKKDGYPELDPAYNEYCTDIMYDSYSPWNDETRKTYLEALKSKGNQNQWLWECPKGFSDNPEQIDEMVNHIKGAYTEALNEPRFVGILSFSFADGLEGDWGYGLHTFFNNSDPYYSRELKRLYVDIGRKVTGRPDVDHSTEVEIVLGELREVYNVGEEIDLPAYGAVDGNDNPISVTPIVTSPSGQNINVDDDYFKATESGLYKMTVTVGEGANKIEKSTTIAVRYPHEISRFDTDAYLADTDMLDKDSVWNWPREIDTEFGRNGGSLKVTPHRTDGTWPTLTFSNSGNTRWDVSMYDYISMWVYNTSDEPLKSFGFWADPVPADQAEDKQKWATTVKDIPAKEWTQYVIRVDAIEAKLPGGSKDCKLVFGNMASGYANRAAFYIDDVELCFDEDIEVDPDVIDFENYKDTNRIGDNQDDVWTWPYAISTEQAHGGRRSLKVTTRLDGGKWPNVVFTRGETETFDLTNAATVSVWVYTDYDKDIANQLGFKINNGEGVNQYIKQFTIPARTWTQLIVTRNEIVSGAANIDLTKVKISFNQSNGNYTDKCDFYLDDFVIEREGVVVENNHNLDFEKSAQLLKVDFVASDWNCSISEAQAHGGTHSMKVVPNKVVTASKWPNLTFKTATGEGLFDLTGYESVSIWIYFDSENAIDGSLGFQFTNGSKDSSGTPSADYKNAQITTNVPARTWTKITVNVSTLTERGFDLTKVKIQFSQMKGTYEDRADFYLDDFELVKATEEE